MEDIRTSIIQNPAKLLEDLEWSAGLTGPYCSREIQPLNGCTVNDISIRKLT
jgi:hypothetical protein